MGGGKGKRGYSCARERDHDIYTGLYVLYQRTRIVNVLTVAGRTSWLTWSVSRYDIGHTNQRGESELEASSFGASRESRVQKFESRRKTSKEHQQTTKSINAQKIDDRTVSSQTHSFPTLPVIDNGIGWWHWPLRSRQGI
jgi:hypothetical protein